MTGNPHAMNFGLALRRVLERGDQTRLARILSRETSTVHGWVSGAHEPDPRTAIAIEEALDLEPGSLTIHLGFLPPAARDVTIASPEEAVIADSQLSGRDKRVLLDMLVVMRDHGES